MMEGESDRKKIEEYLKLYCIEEILDETINDIIERRPANPYVEIAKLIEAKTIAEIIEVRISPTILSYGRSGVQVFVNTNLGEFSGESGFKFDDSIPQMMDFLNDQLLLDDALRNLDPKDLLKIDQILDTLSDLRPEIVLAASIACTKAGARHSGQPVYKYIASLMEIDPCIPLPIVSIISRSIGSTQSHLVQNVCVAPIACNTYHECMERILELNHQVMTDIASKQLSIASGDMGCGKLLNVSLHDVVQIVVSAGDALGSGLKPYVDLRHGNSSTKTEGADGDSTFSYASNGGDAPRVNGPDVVEGVVGLWKECEMVGVEDPTNIFDDKSQRQLKLRIAETLNAVRGDPNSSELSYAVGGIGGDTACCIQVVADYMCCQSDILTQLSTGDNGYNTVKLRLETLSTISNVMQMCKTATRVGWKVILGCSKDSPEPNDTFLADLAVGLGASQFMGGGLLGGEYIGKYNRILEIQRSDPNISFVGVNFRN